MSKKLKIFISPSGKSYISQVRPDGATLKELAQILVKRAGQEIKRFFQNFPELKAGHRLLVKEVGHPLPEFFTSIAQGKIVDGFCPDDLLGIHIGPIY